MSHGRNQQILVLICITLELGLQLGGVETYSTTLGMFHSNNFAGSAAWAQVCSLLCSILVSVLKHAHIHGKNGDPSLPLKVIFTMKKGSRIIERVMRCRPDAADVFYERQVRNANVNLFDNLIVAWVHAQNDVACCLHKPVSHHRLISHSTLVIYPHSAASFIGGGELILLKMLPPPLRVPTLLPTKKSRTFQDPHEKFSRTFSEPANV